MPVKLPHVRVDEDESFMSKTKQLQIGQEGSIRKSGIDIEAKRNLDCGLETRWIRSCTETSVSLKDSTFSENCLNEVVDSKPLQNQEQSLKYNINKIVHCKAKDIRQEVEAKEVIKEASSYTHGEGRGGISLIGSWVLRSCSNIVNMNPKASIPSADNGELSASIAHPVGQNRSSYPWRFETGTSFVIRVSHIVKLFILWIFVMGVAAIIFHGRIRALETEKNELKTEASLLKMDMNLLVERVDRLSSLIPLKSSYDDNDVDVVLDVYSGEDDDMSEEENLSRKKRSAVSAPGRTNKNLQYSRDFLDINSLHNGTVSYNLTEEGWTTNATPATATKISKGNKGMTNKERKRVDRLVSRKLKDFKNASRLHIKKLSQKVSHLQKKLRSATANPCCKRNSSGNLAKDTYEPTVERKSPRAAYLLIDGPSVNIKKRKQIIGPWYLPEAGRDTNTGLNFGDTWYDNLELDSNGTSILFQENGLFLIYAQVFYQLQQVRNVIPTPMGYRIHLRKNWNCGERKCDRKRNPITIAECVPSFPTTIYQTCFTQVAWYVEANDELYLEHFTDSRPIIEAQSTGQTFLGIVRLSS